MNVEDLYRSYQQTRDLTPDFVLESISQEFFESAVLIADTAERETSINQILDNLPVPALDSNKGTFAKLYNPFDR